MKKIVTTPFNRTKVPPKQNLFFMPFIWLICWLQTRAGKLKIRKVHMKGLKPPYIVLGTHMAFSDFLVTPLALFPHRANYVSELEGFEYYGEWIYRQVGCLGTRKFVNDFALLKNIKKVMERKGILVLYPEARYANVGTSSLLPASVGKLVKLLKVPVVVIHMKGNYLESPIWNLTKRKGAQLEAVLTQIYTAEELKDIPAEQVQKTLQEHLTYDEYDWQFTSEMKIPFYRRAEGLELVLYQCPCCGTEFRMASDGAGIFCLNCKVLWVMNELGKLECNNKTSFLDPSVDFSHIPDWYEWERRNVIQEIDTDKYHLNINVHIESLPNAINFIDLGIGRLKHNQDGFALTFTEYGESEPKTLTFHPLTMTSIHTECNYRDKGECVTLSTPDNTYFLFPCGKEFNNVKIMFATEYLYQKCKAKVMH